MGMTLITGAPGSGKSAAMVAMMQDWAKKGRAIYVDGVPELTVQHEVLEDAQRWHLPGVVPDGSLIVIDEAQRVWRPAGAGSKVPDHIAALETHRHRGLDFIIVTQHPGLLHSNVRKLCSPHVHIRDVGVLGRWWYEWPETSNPDSFRTAPVKKRYSIPPVVKSAYRSASIHIKPVRSIPPALIIGLVAIVALCVLVWYGWSRISQRFTPLGETAKPLAVSVAARPAASAASSSRPALPAPAVQAPAIAGCVSSDTRCFCFDAQGRFVVLEAELCKRSAREFSGVVPLSGALGDGRS